MQREFSKELTEDRDFEIGGEVFTWMYPHWTVGADILDGRTRPASKNGEKAETDERFFKVDTEYAIKAVPMFLDPKNNSHERWKKLTARKENPIPRHQIVQLYVWLMEQASGFPTTPPSDSLPGDGSNGEPSQDE